MSMRKCATEGCNHRVMIHVGHKICLKCRGRPSQRNKTQVRTRTQKERSQRYWAARGVPDSWIV